jgi:hypothetical protein
MMTNTEDCRDLLDQLGLREGQFRVTGLMPLVEVAWADGRVQLAERVAIQAFARRWGWLADGGEEVLDAWLSRKPDDETARKARGAFKALAFQDRGLGASMPREALDAALRACIDVARAAGGLFGLTEAISDAEASVLDSIAGAFGAGDWRKLDAIDGHTTRDPEVLPGRPLVGNLTDFVDDPIDTLSRAWHQLGDAFRLDLGPVPVFVVVHPDDVQRVLVENSRNYVRPMGIEFMKEVTGDSVLTTDGALWRARRRILQPALHGKQVRGMACTMVRAAEELRVEWMQNTAGTPFDIQGAMSQLALRIAGLTLFGPATRDRAHARPDQATARLPHAVERAFPQSTQAARRARLCHHPAASSR